MFDGGELLVASATFAGVYVLLRWMNGDRGSGKRYPPSLPLLPFYWAIIRGGMSVMPDYFRRASAKLGPIFSFRIGRRLVVVLNGHETIINALVRQSETFADRCYLHIENKIINPDRRGIIFAHYNDLFKKYHKMSLSILKEFGFGVNRVMETRILQEVESLNEELLKLSGRPFDPKWPITFATSNVVLSIALGRNFQQAFPNDHSAIVSASNECVANMDLILNMAPIVRFLPMFRKKVHALRETSKRLLSKIEVGIDFAKSPSADSSFIGRFIEIEGPNYDHQDLILIVRDFIFAGTETMSTTVQWTMMELANHPAVLTRVQREIDEIVPRDRFPSLDDKPHLPYSEAVFLEAMRRRIVVPFYVPHSPLKDTQLLGYDIPKDCMILPNAYGAQMDPVTWKDPENFRPERFLNRDNKVIDSEKMIAFGMGKRSCLGEILGRQTAFLFVTSLVQRFDLLPPEGQDSIYATEVVATSTVPSHFEIRAIPRVRPAQKMN